MMEEPLVLDLNDKDRGLIAAVGLPERLLAQVRLARVGHSLGSILSR